MTGKLTQAQHLLVDEYQDINAAQFKLIDLLSRGSRNGLFVVGDDAQSIYGFRGGDPKFILDFSQNYPNTRTPTLAHSRRCHEKTMEAAFKVLAGHYEAWTGKPELVYERETGDDPYVWQLPSNIKESIMAAIVAKDAVLDKKSVLILAPKKEFFGLVIAQLSRRGIGYNCPLDLLPKRLVVAKRFVDWINDPRDSFLTRLVIEDLINTGIAQIPGAAKDKRSSPETIKKRIAEEKEIAKLWEMVDRKKDLFTVIEELENPNKTIRKIREGLSGLLESYADSANDNQGEFAKELSVVSGIWTDPAKMADDVNTVMELVRTLTQTGSGSVLLRTMRKAKGLEAQVVIILGLEDDLVPDFRSDDLEEEARLFYVSMTRAIEELYLFHAYQRPRNISYGDIFKNKRRSRFLEAIGIKSEYKPFGT